MEEKIKAIQKSCNEVDIFFSTDEKVVKQYRVDEIKLELRQVSSDLQISVYRGYRDGKVYFEIGANIDVCVYFW